MRFATIALLGFATSFAVLACQAEQPASFQGPKIGKAGADRDKDNDNDNDEDDAPAGTTTTQNSDPEPSGSTTQTTTPPPDAGPAIPNCTGTNTLQACLTCCDSGGVYQAFYTKAVACNFEPTCKTAASNECFASPTCTASDKCMAQNGCWTKPDPEGEGQP